MKNVLFIFLATVLVGCGSGIAPKGVGSGSGITSKGMVISTDKSKNQALIETLQMHSPEITVPEISVRMVGNSSTEEVLKALEWAEFNNVKVIIIDGDATRSVDPKVWGKIKAMNKAGFYLSALEFA